MRLYFQKLIVMSALIAASLWLPASYAVAIQTPVSESTPAPTPTTPPAASTEPASTVAQPSTTADNTAPAEEAKQPAAKEPDASAKESRKVVAHVVWVKGSFYATAPGSDEKRELKTSGNVFMNDTLVTSLGSEAQIVFSDNSLMTFRPETKFYVNEYNYQPKGKKVKEEKSAGKYVMDLFEGGFRTITGYVAKEEPDNYQVNTPVATIGVRGTEYSVVYAKNGELFLKQYKGVPCVTKGKDSKDKASAVCLNKKDRFASVDKDGNIQVLEKQPEVFNVDVEVVPVTFSENTQGFCGVNGCGSGDSGGGSGFCIQ